MGLEFLRGRQVALGVGGGIAAYKACDLVRELGRAGASVRVAMTPGAQQFVTPLTFQSLSGHPVFDDLFDPAQDSSFGHLHLARWADVFVLAPVTADLLARVRAGMANDAVTTSVLAFQGPVLLAPAMNTAMWDNERTQDNLKALLAEPRYRVVGPESGLLADGDVGAGRLASLAALVEATAGLGQAGPLAGRRVLVTAGPTREHFDPVRFISNPSSGKMGVALAEVARARGAQVTLVLGPTSVRPAGDIEVISVVSAEQMGQAVLERVDGVDLLIAAAAVSDWRPKVRAGQKIKKHDGDQAAQLERTVDVLAAASQQVHALPRRPVLVGFAAETEAVLAHAAEKLQRKRLDFIVANDVGQAGAGFEVDTNRVTVLGANGSQVEAAGPKREVAARILDAVMQPSR